MFDYDFMRTAFAASGVTAVLAGIVGYFLVLRSQTFAGHALSHVGFTGATGAILFGLSPLAGMIGFTLIAGIGMGFFGEKLAERDVAIGMMLSLALGLGLLFLHFYTSAATQAAWRRMSMQPCMPSSSNTLVSRRKPLPSMYSS